MPNVEPKATHGMVVMGEETVYLSHMGMFMDPHAVQNVLEVTLRSAAGDARQLYVDDRRTTGTAVYTLAPEPFRLSDLVAPEGQEPALTSFTGTLFRGHFERGGTPILDPVTVDVRRVVRFRRFDHDDPRPGTLNYLAYGKGDELFLGHWITRAPDFDHHVAVRAVPGGAGDVLTDDVLREGPRLEIAGRADRPEDRLHESDQVTVRFLDGGPAGIDLRLAVEREFYEEEGDLAHEMHAH
ncbi:hypothetical protein [Streptomyces sp. NPDC003247]|uniref:hypothetical protein n=1 Tax=Streptomyces sp. NPDC003247 TaxID=3364677 RepID=UPI00369233CB